MRKLIIILVYVPLIATSQAQTIYVDADSHGLNDGSSWTNAYSYLQDALSNAAAGDDILVAQGTYRPDRNAANPTGSGDRNAAFQLINGVTLKGGYAGFGQPDPNARDTELYETVLSGDFLGNDGPNFTNNGENSYHVVTGNGTDDTAVLDGFSITAGNADGRNPPICFGGGMFTEAGSPTVNNCTFMRNYSQDGGGMYSASSTSLITNCMFTGNLAGDQGGGMMILENSEMTLVNCIFSSNTANIDSGGGLYVSHSTTTLINCIFNQNSSKSLGGALQGSSYAETALINCIFWANTAYEGPQIAMYYSSIVSVSYSDVQGGQAAIYLYNSSVDWGDGNINADPLFQDPDGIDNTLGTKDDNLRLLTGSPCVDAGDNTAVPSSVTTDFDGNPRFIDDPETPDTGNGTPPIVDMGAYEGPEKNSFVLSTELTIVPEDGAETFTVALLNDPCEMLSVEVTRRSGDSDIIVQSGALLLFDSSNYSVPQTVTLAAVEDDDHIDGTASIEVNASGFSAAGVTAVENDNEPNKNTLFVDAVALGANNGSSWGNAFADLQDALDTAVLFSQFEQILVAQGTYKPAGAGGDRIASFQLVDGVTVYGGFPTGGGSWNSRDPDTYQTILSGDLNGDDGPHFANNNENSYHVVNSTGTGDTTVLDGFTITAGNADGNHPYNLGGGIYNEGGENYGCTATFSNCKIIANYADFGGAMLNNYTGIVIIGMGGPGPTLTNCILTDNAAGIVGGAIYNTSSNPSLDNCTISWNSAVYEGGGIYNDGICPLLTDCVISENSVEEYGGGVANRGCLGPMFINCTICNNSAGLTSGGIDNYLSTLILKNCILWGNSDSGGTDESAQVDITSSTNIDYCCVQGWTGTWGGIGNFGDDPCFVGMYGGDYHLKSRVGHWNPLTQVWVQDYTTSPCIDAGDPNSDWTAELWPHGKRINIGAYGGTPQASMSLSDVGNIANLDNDLADNVNFNDLRLLVNKWLKEEILIPEDLNRDGVVNFIDYAIFAEYWLEGAT